MIDKEEVSKWLRSPEGQEFLSEIMKQGEEDLKRIHDAIHFPMDKLKDVQIDI